VIGDRFEDERLLWPVNWAMEPPPADPEAQPQQRLAWHRSRLWAVTDLPDIAAYEP
jgi:hypothetical protein